MSGNRGIWQLAVLVLGVVMAAVLSVQLWRSSRLEGRLRSAELASERLLAERILRQAASGESHRAFDVALARPSTVANGPKPIELRGRTVVVDEAVAWLTPVADEVANDDVVLDRLERATQAEFVDRDAAAAARQYDQLLAGPLRRAWRIRALSAACWHSRRAGLEARSERLEQELRSRLDDVRAEELADPVMAHAVAASSRLRAGLLPEPKRAALLPYLPAEVFASLQVDEDVLRRRHEQACRRRQEMLALQSSVRVAVAAVAGADPASARGASRLAGVRALAGKRVAWLGPEDAAGTRLALVLSVAAWFEILREAGREAGLFAWPLRIEPDFVVDPTGRTSPPDLAAGPPPAGVPRFAGVPWLKGLREVDSVSPSSQWLLPGIVLLLGGGFAFAFVQQRRAARREAAAIATQQQFLTTVTHELKTPLAGIRLLGEMLGEGRAKGREHEYYRLLVGESARLSLLIDNVLDLGRLERGEREYTLQPLSLVDVVRETLELFAPVLEKDGLEVEFVGGEAQAHRANIDRDAFVQALIVVLDNARKYGADGGRVELALSADAGEPSAGGDVQLVVRDYGAGVPAAERERIFDRFVRGAAHQHGSQPGVGIGLFLARSIVRRLGGELRCGAPADGGAGAIFAFSLPRAAGDSSATERADAAGNHQSP
ncbi:MAG: sensor histidine kinase [Planctomycetota bacterium]